MFFLVMRSVSPYASQGATRTDDEAESSAVFRYNTVKCKLFSFFLATCAERFTGSTINWKKKRKSTGRRGNHESKWSKTIT